EQDQAITVAPLATEEDGVALLAGAWLGGQRGALLLQSSGVGNCINMLGLPAICRLPLLMLVTMRGEWGEFNPWQVTMGQAVQPTLEAMDVLVFRAERAADVGATVDAAARMAFEGPQAVAVLLAQQMIGAKSFTK
ncbi:MAG: phosphonopyruvate decarboxylase, partial [Rhodospirillales bacterium]